MRSDLHDIKGQIHARTDRAILFSDDGEKESAVWLPLVHVEIDEKRHGIAVVTLPEWLAVDRGLL